jgi:two-component system response regulator AtoC
MNKPLIEKLSRKNILVIDDDGLVTRTLCNLLKRGGYFASGTESSSEAIEQTEDTNYDLIIADIKMPEVDGVETINRIQALSRVHNKPKVPVVFITGYADDDNVSQAKQLGEVIFKPFDNNEFLHRIAKYLD